VVKDCLSDRLLADFPTKTLPLFHSAGTSIGDSGGVLHFSLTVMWRRAGSQWYHSVVGLTSLDCVYRLPIKVAKFSSQVGPPLCEVILWLVVVPLQLFASTSSGLSVSCYIESGQLSWFPSAWFNIYLVGCFVVHSICLLQLLTNYLHQLSLLVSDCTPTLSDLVAA
jgi:hypothetical protein